MPRQQHGRHRPTIAVLPFENISGDPEQEYFADGLTEDLVTALTHWRSFPVIARSSSFTFKGRSVNAPAAAAELGATYVVEGSVRKAGSRVRVTAQLIDGPTGHHVWAERYDRELEDIFDVQDDLVHRIAAIIAPEVSRAELHRTTLMRTKEMDAWDHHLRGEAAMARQTPGAARPRAPRRDARPAPGGARGLSVSPQSFRQKQLFERQIRDRLPQPTILEL